MARTAAMIKASIWDVNGYFRRLTPDAQRLYFLILSQPQLTNCGVIPYAPEKWARMAAGDSLDQVERAVTELEREQYVIVDRDTRELLVRTFMRHDKVLGTPQLLKAAQREYGQVESATLRETLAVTYPGVFADPSTDLAAEAHETHSSTRPETGTPTGTETGRGTGGSSRGHDRGPLPLTPYPEPQLVEGAEVAAASTARAPAPPAAAAADLDKLLDELKVGKQLKAQAGSDPPRALACAQVAIGTPAIRNRGAYFRTLWETGELPSRRHTDAADPRPLHDVCADLVRNLGHAFTRDEMLAEIRDREHRRHEHLDPAVVTSLLDQHQAVLAEHAGVRA